MFPEAHPVIVPSGDNKPLEEIYSEKNYEIMDLSAAGGLLYKDLAAKIIEFHKFREVLDAMD